MTVRKHARILMYSHDSFGLGHLRRCRAIAHHLVGECKDLTVLILTGSPIIGNFDFRSRVDFVRIPGIIKLRDGDYTSLSLHIDTEETLAMRASIIKHTADIFNPDIFIVDKEPLGLRGEVEDTLEMLQKRGTHLVLGLRDIMDDPDLLEPEWQRKNVLPALETLYDSIWVYGLEEICNPLEGISISQTVRDKMTFTGYLPREVSASAAAAVRLTKIEGPYILVTPGGGGDGEDVVDWVLRAYEARRDLPHPSLIVLGPFMASEAQTNFLERAEHLDDVEIITFDKNMEALVNDAIGLIAMGGYNTFCEILSFDKRAVIVPRTRPRLEQFIRASQAEKIGLALMLEDDGMRNVEDMINAILRLPSQAKPSETTIPGLLEGLERVEELTRDFLSDRFDLGPKWPRSNVK